MTLEIVSIGTYAGDDDWPEFAPAEGPCEVVVLTGTAEDIKAAAQMFGDAVTIQRTK